MTSEFEKWARGISDAEHKHAPGHAQLWIKAAFAEIERRAIIKARANGYVAYASAIEKGQALEELQQEWFGTGGLRTLGLDSMQVKRGIDG